MARRWWGLAAWAVLTSCAPKTPLEPAPLERAQEDEREHGRAGTAERDTHASGSAEPERLASAPDAAGQNSGAKGSPRSFSEQTFPGAVFPPADPGPPFERSAQAGDGRWTPFFDAASAGDGARKKPGARNPSGLSSEFAFDALRRMVLHPHEASRFQTLTLAALDLGLLSAVHRPGVSDVEDMGKKELISRAGLVPEEAHGALVALMNGGFQPKHGRWGMLSLDTQVVPPREDGCTVAVLADGTVRIGPWPEIEKLLDRIVAYRQSPPCLVHEGKRHPKLEKPDRAPWAGQQADLKTRRRSAVGISEDGRTLIYGLGEETEPEVLASGMKHAGAHHAAQLDINWNWTRFFVFESQGGETKLVGALEEDMAKDRGEYVNRPGKRGFFYFTRRVPPSQPEASPPAMSPPALSSPPSPASDSAPPKGR